MVPSSELQSPADILYQMPGGICINCSLMEATVKACVAIVYQTAISLAISLLGNNLEIHTINTSTSTTECFQVNTEEYTIAVFALLQSGLERHPLITAVISDTPVTTTTTGAINIIV